MLCQALRQQVLETAKLIQRYGLVWMAGGTVCARDPPSGYIVVTPSGLPYEILTPGDMIVTDIEMHVVDGYHKPSVAHNLWTAIFRARPDVYAIIHTHSPYATAFSVVGKAIPVITETMAGLFGQAIPVARYAHLEDPHFVGAPLEALGQGFAVLLERHGPIVVGDTLKRALERAVTLEETAKIFAIANSIGTPIIFNDTEAARSFDYYMHRYGQTTASSSKGQISTI